ncbi:hypothetical protein VNO77_22708 [Canavalia gladiata]|uniref:Uncharacterized protein n=1 Tax=Canavalia gladiata TaxID=3824 RepID=A0AAN9QAU1_CANGL
MRSRNCPQLSPQGRCMAPQPESPSSFNTGPELSTLSIHFSSTCTLKSSIAWDDPHHRSNRLVLGMQLIIHANSSISWDCIVVLDSVSMGLYYYNIYKENFHSALDPEIQSTKFDGLINAPQRHQEYKLSKANQIRVGKCVETVWCMCLAPQARINGVSLLIFLEFSLLLPSAPKLVSFLAFLEGEDSSLKASLMAPLCLC